MAATPVPITSLTNSRVKDLVRLRQRRHRDRLGAMIVEEPLVIRRGLDAGITCREVYFCPEILSDAEGSLLQEILVMPGIRAFELTLPVMTKVAYRDRPQGLLVVAAQPVRELDGLELPPDEPALFMVLEAVEKPGNLGAVQRIADGAGAHAIIMCGGGVDPWNPNVLRSSRGACFAVPTVQAGTTALLGWLRGRGVATVAATPAAATCYTGFDLTGPTAILLGTEHDGLSPRLLDAADAAVAIPMLGCGDSLNVSTSAAILLYEALRQRIGTRKAT